MLALLVQHLLRKAVALCWRYCSSLARRAIALCFSGIHLHNTMRAVRRLYHCLLDVHNVLKTQEIGRRGLLVQGSP